MEKPRVVVIGLDGATWDLIKPWANKGELPTFKWLMENGAWGYLESTIPPVTGPAWVSFATGKNPGKHGIFDFVYLENGRLKMHSSKDIKSKVISDFLSEAGMRSVIISLPLSFPPSRDFKGIMVSDFLYPRKEIYPSSKMDYIKSYKLIPDLIKKGKRALREMIDSAERRLRLAKTLFGNEEWDFFFLWYGETDSVSHHFWKEMKSNTKLGQEARKIFHMADSFLEDILKEMDKNTLLILMSDHGFGDYPYAVNLNVAFKQRGWLKTKAIKDSSELDESINEHIKNMFGKGTRIITVPGWVYKLATSRLIKPILLKILRIIRFKRRINPEKIDFDNSIAFVPDESLIVYVKEGNKGRKEEITKEIIDFTTKLEFNGKRVFKHVLKNEEVYSGSYVESSPDILLIPNGFLVRPSIKGELFTDFEPASFHEMNGIFLAYGPGVKKGHEIENAKIYDVAPTILHMFNLPIPDDMDGKVLMDIFEEDGEFAKRKPRYVDPSYYEKESKKEELRSKIRRRLRKINDDR